jgi:hypothetical protein
MVFIEFNNIPLTVCEILFVGEKLQNISTGETLRLCATNKKRIINVDTLHSDETIDPNNNKNIL